MNLVPMKDLQLHLFKMHFPFKRLNNATRGKQLIPVGIALLHNTIYLNTQPIV